MIALRTALFFLPLAWITMSGPLQAGVLLAGFVIGMVEVLRLRLVPDLLSAWPMGVLVALWCAFSVLGDLPAVDDLLLPRTMACGFLFCSAAGVCIREYSRRSQNETLAGLMIAALTLTMIGLLIASTSQATEAVSTDTGQIQRENPEEGMVILGMFRADNIVVGIISYTLYAAVLLPLIFLELPKKALVVCVVGSLLALALNLKLVTRTVFLTLPVASMVVFTVLLRSRHSLRMGTLGWKALAALAITLAGIGVFAFMPGDPTLLLDRFSESTDDPRWDIWAESIRIIREVPWGGGYRMLTLHSWAHNLFLDAALFNGLQGMFVMAGIYALIWSRTARAMLAPESAHRPVDVYLAACVAALAAVHMLMPPMLHLTLFNLIAYTVLGGVREEEEEEARYRYLDTEYASN